MKKIGILIVFIGLIGCHKNSLQQEFNCAKPASGLALKEYRDVLKKFRIKLPKDWKTQLYYDEFQSEISSADTTKGLTDTFIFDITWHQGELNLTPSFDQNVKDTLAIKEQLSFVKSSFIDFKKNSSYFNLSKGTSSGYVYHYLQMYIKTEVDEYITFSTKVYGENAVDERLCESIAFFDNVEFIK